jgi:hypothetical protein
MAHRSEVWRATAIIALVLLGTGAVFAASDLPPPAASQVPPLVFAAKIMKFDPTQSVLTLADSAEPLHVQDLGLRELLTNFHENDRVIVEVIAKDNEKTLTGLSVPVSLGVRLVLLALLAVFWLLVAALLCQTSPKKLLIGEDNRYSNSKFQVASWFGTVVLAYTATVALRLWGSSGQLVGGVNIPENLLLLSGLSALTFAAAKGITQTKVDNATQQQAAAPAGVVVPQKTAAAAPSWTDLTRDDNGRLDLGDFQMLFVTLLAIATYLGQVLTFLSVVKLASVPGDLHTAVTLPDVDSTILATFGLGQGAYLGKKLASDIKK